MESQQLVFGREVAPDSVGLNRKLIRQASHYFDQELVNGNHVGGQLVLLRHGKVVLDRTNGVTRIGSRQSVRPDTPFVTFSCTKPLTAICMLQLIEMELVELDGLVADYWPEFGQKGKETATIRHVLTHQSGIPSRGLYPQIPRWWSWEWAVSAVADLEAEYEPGTKTAYHLVNYGFILGEIVRRVSGKPIEQYMEDHIFRPLNMRSSWLGLPRDQMDRAAELYSGHSDQTGTAMLFRSARHAVLPAATLNSTARDLAVFYQALLNGGTINGRRIIEEKTLEEAIKVHFAGHDHIFDGFVRWGLGFLLGGEKPAEYGDRAPSYGRRSLSTTFGHPGQRSTLTWADREKDIAFTFMVNTLLGDMENNKRWVDLSDMIWEAIED